MNRRKFLTGAALAGLAAATLPKKLQATEKSSAPASWMPKLYPPQQQAQLNLCLQWWGIPGKEMNEKLDYLEKNGYGAVELPSGNWLFKNKDALLKAMHNRKLFIATACGPSNFAYASKERREAEVQKFLPQLEVLGELHSVGLILCPARAKPELGLKELREDFVTNTGKRLAQKAAECGTHIVLEPLRRNETPFLRQVADGAAIARDIGKGAAVMGDFWHMKLEETSFFGSLMCGGELLKHIHIASLAHRRVPGTDGAVDNYVDGFKALKLLGYRGAVSFEGGFPKNSNHHELLTKMCALLREQWAMA